MTYKITVVEDEPQVLELLRLILRHTEIEVFTALDGNSGLELIRQIKPDLVLLDIMMPNMNGWDVYDAIRTDASIKHIPIIIESVLPERPERKMTFAESSIDYYFTKPFDTTRLRREVGRMLGNENLWPPPKPRPPRPQPLTATSEFLSMLQIPPDSAARAAADSQADKPHAIPSGENKPDQAASKPHSAS